MDVVTVGDGPTALDAALTNSFDVILLDEGPDRGADGYLVNTHAGSTRLAHRS